MNTVKSIQEVRSAVAAARGQGMRIGFVPTMGALHEGHRSLVRAAGKECGFVVVSIFVNPTQFGPKEDLSRYPRTPETDLAACREEGAALVFMPEVETMYPPGAATTISVSGLTRSLCGASRPTHFAGVCTIVAKLFNIVEPDCAYFGNKDFQQACVIERMVADLDMPVRVVRCPIVREADGLAMSSRNANLSSEHRRQAAGLHEALTLAAATIRDSAPPAAEVIELMRRRLDESAPAGRVDYIQIVDPQTLAGVEETDGPVLVALAVKFGPTRLIDNVLVGPED
ncbi:MAG: pantoate--beta-alanine ligase [Planctomycetaceae bacterium]|nr:pantoate--beta-alanine ligase [Planctomycetaceae bacterium]